MANLTILRRTRNKRLPESCSGTNYKSRTLFPEFLGQSAAFALHRFCHRLNLRNVLLALGSLLGSYASSAMVFVRHKDFTLMCLIGCPGEPDSLSLSHYNECPLFYNFFASVWGHATVLPRRGHLFHDLITHVFLRSLQYGIVAMGVIDPSVYAYNHHQRNMDNLVNFGDCMKGRIRFMTSPIHCFQTEALWRSALWPPRSSRRFSPSHSRGVSVRAIGGVRQRPRLEQVRRRTRGSNGKLRIGSRAR